MGGLKAYDVVMIQNALEHRGTGLWLEEATWIDDGLGVHAVASDVLAGMYALDFQVAHANTVEPKEADEIACKFLDLQNEVTADV